MIDQPMSIKFPFFKFHLVADFTFLAGCRMTTTPVALHDFLSNTNGVFRNSIKNNIPMILGLTFQVKENVHYLFS